MKNSGKDLMIVSTLLNFIINSIVKWMMKKFKIPTDRHTHVYRYQRFVHPFYNWIFFIKFVRYENLLHQFLSKKFNHLPHVKKSTHTLRNKALSRV